MSKRTYWNDSTSKKLLDICVDERESGSSKFDWPKIAKNLSVQTGMDFIPRQVQNHFDDGKVRYKGWVELQRMNSGIAFDPATKGIQVAETHLERWKAFVEKNKKYAHTLVKKGLSHVDELEKLFAGRSAHGERGFSTAMGKFNLNVEGGEEEERMDVDSETSADAYLNGEGVGKVIHIIGDNNSSPPTPPSSSKKRKAQDTESDEKKVTDASIDSIDRVLDFLVKTAPVPTYNKTEMVGFALREMGVSNERGDQYFVDAMKYLAVGNNMEIFLALENENQKWIFWMLE